MKQASRLLVIDWDYFFHNLLEGGRAHRKKDTGRAQDTMLYDWGHREAPLFINDIWPIRAGSFLAANGKLPSTTGKERTFWSRFNIDSMALMFYADSNSRAADEGIRMLFRNPKTEIFLFDAHHDAGYTQTLEQMRKSMKYDCGDWLLVWNMLNQVAPERMHVRYPRWMENAKRGGVPTLKGVDIAIDDEKPIREPFDHVFVCRSGAWTPSWLDDKFMAFLDASPIGAGERLNLDGMKPRVFDRAQAEANAEQIRKAHRAFLAQKDRKPLAG